MAQCFWKVEPVSPAGTSFTFSDDNWLSTNEDLENAITGDEPVLYDEHYTRAEVATKLLAELDEFKEPLNDWFEEKVNFSIFDGLPLLATENAHQPSASNPIKPLKYVAQPASPPPIPQQWELQAQEDEDTQLLLQELESIFENAEASYQLQEVENVTLTPPISPGKVNEDEETYTFVIPEIDQQPENLVLAPDSDNDEQMVDPIADTPVSVSPSFIDEDGTDMSESMTEDLSLEPLCSNSIIETEKDKESDIDESFSVTLSPGESSSTSYHSSDESTDDPEWSDAGYKKSKSGKMTSVPRRQRKPYCKIKSVEEKRVRKKEQNKTAATRYRIKKKQEVIGILSEEQLLMNKNEELKGKVTDLQREIGYLKGFMKDMFKAKGIMK